MRFILTSQAWYQPLLISAHKAQRDDFIGLQTFLIPSFKVGPSLRQRLDQMTLQHPLQHKLVYNSVISVLSGRNSDGNTHKLLKVKDRYDPSLSHSKINQVHLNCLGSLSYPSQWGAVMIYSLNSVTEDPLILRPCQQASPNNTLLFGLQSPQSSPKEENEQSYHYSQVCCVWVLTAFVQKQQEEATVVVILE